mmetsp:Transcript_148642/g.262726  ORF Transcript_148642/g.262726 Transcript_148642/m.262726 type:complete len:90 (-) Transcript_148642:1585-1854(-)
MFSLVAGTAQASLRKEVAPHLHGGKWRIALRTIAGREWRTDVDPDAPFHSLKLNIRPFKHGEEEQRQAVQAGKGRGKGSGCQGRCICRC